VKNNPIVEKSCEWGLLLITGYRRYCHSGSKIKSHGMPWLFAWRV
jgi:hypothetical protein